MRNTGRQTRENRTITVDFQHETTYFQLLGDGKAFLECVLVLLYRQMRPEVARDALLATHGGLSLELCAVLSHISPMALSRLVCAFGHHSLVTVLTRCGLSLPTYFLADEIHGPSTTEKVYLPTVVCGRVLWHLGYTEAASTAAFTQSYR